MADRPGMQESRDAYELIQNEAFQRAIKAREQGLIKAWQTSKATDERELQWHLLQALGQLVAEIRTCAALAEQERVVASRKRESP